MTFDMWMEIFGYIGSGLVIISMLMTSVVKLRVINMCGATISAVYAAVIAAWPVVLLNAALILIQILQLIRLQKEKQRAKKAPSATN